MEITKQYIPWENDRVIFTIDEDGRNICVIEYTDINSVKSAFKDITAPARDIPNILSVLLEYNGYNYDRADILDIYRSNMSKLIDNYYNSDAVNGCAVNGVELWLNFETRQKLRARLEAEKKSGVESTTVWFNDIKFELPIDKTMLALTDLEVYAGKCFDVYNKLKAEVKDMSIDDIVNNDYMSGYPDKLNFSI